VWEFVCEHLEKNKVGEYSNCKTVLEVTMKATAAMKRTLVKVAEKGLMWCRRVFLIQFFVVSIIANIFLLLDRPRSLAALDLIPIWAIVVYGIVCLIGLMSCLERILTWMEIPEVKQAIAEQLWID
jgi:hypothetical protein